MSWPLTSFALLALALGVGFGWYERSRPPARVVALVGVLAALAALGRIAFAAIPNVKPTTDIVIISGYALGGAPGFVVGALAALTSNFFFGQGPWTPWQMTGWGAAGLMGAGLAALLPGTLRRWQLALVCAVIGYAFTALQDVGEWVTYSDHSLAQLGFYVGRGMAFDLIHAAGCVAFALAFGPTLLAALRRFSRRLEVTWLPLAPLALLLLAVGVVGAVGPRATPAAAAGTPQGYLLGAQNADGGFGPAPGASSESLYSGWSALGLLSAGADPARVARGGASLLRYVETNPGGDVGSVERTILVQAAAGAPGSVIAPMLGRLQGAVRGDGSVSGQVNLTAFGLLALRAATAPVPGATPAWLARQQNPDGGFGYGTRGGGSDVDDTGAALEALGQFPGASHAVGFLRAQQNPDGGFPSQPNGDSNTQSTAWAIQGLLAAGVDPDGVRTGGHSPLGYLRSLIAGDGHVRYSTASDQTPVWVTAEALMALERRPLPLPPIAHAAGPRVARRHTGRAAGAPHHAARPRERSAGPARRRGRHSAAGPPPLLDRLAGGAGVLTALACAPVGI